MELQSSKSVPFLLFVIIYNTVVDDRLQLADKPSPSHSLTSPKQDGENQKGKSEKKLMGQYKDSLACEEKLQAKQNEAFIPYFPLAGGCPATSCEGGSQHM